MSLSTENLNFMISFFRKEIGLAMGESKLYLIRTRLLPLARKHNIKTIDLLVDEIQRNQHGAMALEALDHMTTNETLFFRDAYPFEMLKKHLFPELINKKSSFQKIKIWSAAASTGQEAFSIAMVADKEIPQAESRVKIIGTDISKKSIAYANEATYKKMETQRGLGDQNLSKYFSPTEDGTWKVNGHLKSMVEFREANLISSTLTSNLTRYSPFDIVFCRNVLIYFDVDQRKLVVDQIAQLTDIGGYLLTGAGEVVEGNSSKWEAVRFENRPIWRLVAKH